MPRVFISSTTAATTPPRVAGCAYCSGGYLDTPPGALRFGYGPRGKPFLEGPSGGVWLQRVAFAWPRAAGLRARAGGGHRRGGRGAVGGRTGRDSCAVCFPRTNRRNSPPCPPTVSARRFSTAGHARKRISRPPAWASRRVLQTIEVTLDPGQPPTLRAPPRRGGRASRANMDDLRFTHGRRVRRRARRRGRFRARGTF